MADERERAGGEPRTRLSQYFGDRFEEYISTVLSSQDGRHEIVREHQFRRKQNYLSPDTIVFDGGRRPVTVLLQTKVRRLSAATFFGHDGAALTEDINQVLAEPIFQSIKYLYLLSKAQEDDAPRP